MYMCIQCLLALLFTNRLHVYQAESCVAVFFCFFFLCVFLLFFFLFCFLLLLLLLLFVCFCLSSTITSLPSNSELTCI